MLFVRIYHTLDVNEEKAILIRIEIRRTIDNWKALETEMNAKVDKETSKLESLN